MFALADWSRFCCSRVLLSLHLTKNTQSLQKTTITLDKQGGQMRLRKNAQNMAQFFVKINTFIYLIPSCTVEKIPKYLLYFGNLKKTAQSKQPPIRRKFAQSGHPVDKIHNTRNRFIRTCVHFEYMWNNLWLASRGQYYNFKMCGLNKLSFLLKIKLVMHKNSHNTAFQENSHFAKWAVVFWHFSCRMLYCIPICIPTAPIHNGLCMSFLLYIFIAFIVLKFTLTMTTHNKFRQQHCNVLRLKNLTLWRDSNPGYC
jgi:hypothetical protein